MKKNFLRLFMLSVSGMLILCIPFSADAVSETMVINQETCWLMQTVACFAFCTGFSKWIMKNNRLSIGIPDILITLLAITLLLNYPFFDLAHYQVVTYLCLWFCLRICLTRRTSLSFLYFVIIMVIGTVEAFFTLSERIIDQPADSILFQSHFLRYDIISGYTLSTFPLSVWIIFKFRKCNKMLLSHRCTQIYYLSYIAAFFSFLAILSKGINGVSILAFLSCQWILWRTVFRKEIAGDKSGKLLPGLYIIAGITFLLFFCSGLFFFGKDWLATHALLNETAILYILLFFPFMGLIIYKGIRKRRYGVVMAILSLLLVGIPSYFINKPHFMVLLIFLSVITISSPYDSGPVLYVVKKQLVLPGMICFLLLFLLLQFYKHQFKESGNNPVREQLENMVPDQLGNTQDKVLHYIEYNWYKKSQWNADYTDWTES